MKKILLDANRYGNKKMPGFQKIFRKYQQANNKLSKMFYKLWYHFSAAKNHIEIPLLTQIGGGLYIVHPYCIRIA